MKALLEFLAALQEECGGAIPVDVWMREALFHPELGYYAKTIRTVGRRGDFATSASLGSVLGGAIAGWIRSLGERRDLIEVGAGTGALAGVVWKALGWRGRFGRRYHIVETSPVLRKEQRGVLGDRRFVWHESMAGALAACDGRAVIFSNELIDAFPCRVLERRGGKWLDVAVRIEDASVAEVLVERDLPPAASALALDFPDGQRVEVHASAGEWLATWAAGARDVEVLTIDYGDTAERLYHRRPRGTLRAYFHQQRFEGLAVFHRFGKQDMTADVNFSDLMAWGERLGLATVSLESQAEFIRRFGPAASSRESEADRALAEVSGVGDAFRVLWQRRSGA